VAAARVGTTRLRLEWPGLVIISGARSRPLVSELNPTAPPAELSLHIECPALAVDLRVGAEAASSTPVEVWAWLGLQWKKMGNRWGGDFGPGGINRAEANHFDLGRAPRVDRTTIIAPSGSLFGEAVGAPSLPRARVPALVLSLRTPDDLGAGVQSPVVAVPVPAGQIFGSRPRIAPIDVIRERVLKNELLGSRLTDVEGLPVPLIPPKEVVITGPAIQPPQLPPPPVVVLPPPELEELLEPMSRPGEVEDPLPPAIVASPGRFTREEVEVLARDARENGEDEFF